MTVPSAALVELAHSYGVATEFTDWRGERREVPQESVAAVLSAMGVDVSDPAAALEARDQEPWRRTLPACLVLVEGRSRAFPVHVPHGDPVVVDLHLEAGGRRQVAQLEHWVEPRRLDGELVGEATFELPADLPRPEIHALRNAPRLRVPLLVVASRVDGYLDTEDARRLVRAAGSRDTAVRCSRGPVAGQWSGALRARPAGLRARPGHGARRTG